MSKKERAKVERVRQAVILVLRANGQNVSADSVAALTVDEILEARAHLEAVADTQHTMDVFTR